jgi:hypothetical protein
MKRVISKLVTLKWAILFGIIAFCLASVSAPAFSADKAIAKLTSFSGTVLIKSQGVWGVAPAKDLPLYSDDKIVTKIGAATITFDDGAVMDIKANSNLLIRETEETGVAKQLGAAKRQLRLLLGKVLFRSGKGTSVSTSLETTTMVCGLRGTKGTLSVDAAGETYLEFTEGGGDTIGNFISGIAVDVPSELANFNPAQRAAFVAAAAADQAARAVEKLASGEIKDADAAFTGAQAAEAGAREAKAAAEAMLSNPDETIRNEAAAAVSAADVAIEAARAAQQQALNSGATGAALETQITTGGLIGFDMPGIETIQGNEMDIIPGTLLPPDINIEMHPDMITNGSSASFELSVNKEVVITYRLDGGSEIVLSGSSIDLTGLSEGTHEILFIAYDNLGNAGSTSYNWITDYTAPVVSIPIRPGVIANTSNFVFDVADTNKTAGITYQYQLGSGEWTTITGASLASLLSGSSADGIYTINVKATDAAGNESAPTSYTWTYDKTQPVLFVDSTPAAFTTIADVNLSVGYENVEPGTISYSYTLNGAPSSNNLTGLSDGAYTMVVTATDQAGNSSTNTITWVVDTTAPTVTVGGAPATYTNSTGATLSAGHSNPELGTVTYLYTLNGGLPTSSNIVSGLTDGAYTMVVTATDQAGNISTGTITWTVDLIAPASLDASRSAISPTTADLSFSSVELHPGTYSWNLSGPVSQSGTTSGDMSLTGLESGTYTFTWTATDAAGNSTVGTPINFVLKQYAMSGSAGGTDSISGGAQLAASIFSGDPIMDWNGWENNMSGTWDGLYSGPLELASGGITGDNGYWLSAISSGDISGETATGTSNLLILTPTTRIQGISGDFSGTFDPAGGWTGTDSGSPGDMVTTLLSFSSNFYAYDLDGEINGIMGSTDSFYLWDKSWDSPESVDVIGKYEPGISGFALPDVFTMKINSYNPYNGLETIWDLDTSNSGAYYGYLSGRRDVNSSAIDLGFLGLYVDDDGKAGFLKGRNVSGNAYDSIGMWRASGEIFPVQVYSPGALPTDLQSMAVRTESSFEDLNLSIGAFDIGPGVIILDTDNLYTTRIQDGDLSLSVVSELMSGTYDKPSAGDAWVADIYFADAVGASRGAYIGSQWSANKIDAQGYQAWVNFDLGTTGVAGGELTGTFDPTTWKAAANWASMDTATFLSMFEAGRLNELAALNIPCIEVGRVNLTGSGGNLTNVTMTDTIFFADSVSGTVPRIWATGDVSGTTNGLNPVDSSAFLGGTSGTVSFTNVVFKVDKYDGAGGTWNASVIGVATVASNNVEIKGNAAGTVGTPSTTFSGTGSGVVKVTP